MSLLGALLLWAALPPLDLWPLAWLAPVPWIALAERRQLDRPPAVFADLAGRLCFLAGGHLLADFCRIGRRRSVGWRCRSTWRFTCRRLLGSSGSPFIELRLPALVAAPLVYLGLDTGPRAI